MIEFREISKRFGKQKVLNQVSLQLEVGHGVALVGPNGSGKTTMIKILLGLVTSTSGEITLYGKPIEKQSEYRKDIGYMPQINRFPDNMKVGQLFGMLKNMRKDVSKEQYDLDLFKAFEIGKLKDKKLNHLSGGMKQKVSAALAFLFNPQVLVLDEPTAGLDPVSNELFKQKLKSSINQGKLVLITSHILSDLDEITTHVVYLMDGKVRFSKSLEQMKEETSEHRLNRMIAQILNREEVYV
ncbi:ABC transporter ATP-binding protein [Echinicola jeungdonensis]|uniref:ABC transporter ATP-binding protein n=1 Tax=Echinicola jeungdonensis TaxID=709343 RepID=A0ABV5J359_9BACT|nr:ABC transporter ATP-binding protein [Echinicola jeungdonensis]MDN3670689.1 ABC transporter ATP-binding protein [Echinicola jeungdonensis]